MLLTRQEKRSRRRTDAFGYDARSELTSATLGNAAYAYAFDNVGNRSSATEAGTRGEYVGAFPRGERLHFFYNSSVDFGSRSVFDAFRGSGKGIPFPRKTDKREKMKKKSIPLCQPFETPSPAAAETATRPLALQKDGSWFTYGHDLTKNVWEVFGPSGYIRTSYDYAPFGAVTATGDVSQPFRWGLSSSEAQSSSTGLSTSCRKQKLLLKKRQRRAMMQFPLHSVLLVQIEKSDAHHAILL